MGSLKKDYWAPTPKKWRKIGDALLAASTITSLSGMWQFENLKEVFTIDQIRWLIVSPMILGVVGKFLTNFFTESRSKDPQS
jgi:hypothetical protein